MTSKRGTLNKRGRKAPYSKRPVRGGMRVRAYDVLQQAVEAGVNYGWNRAHKHTDTPDAEAIKDAIFNAITSEICDWFDFDEEESDAKG